MAALAQRLGERHQVIVVHPDQIVGLEQLVQLPGEGVVDPQVAAEIAMREFRALELVVQDRPQHAIGKSVVVLLVILLGEITDDIGDVVALDRARLGLGGRRDAPAPTKPRPLHALERRLDGDFKPAGAHGTFVGNSHSIGDYD
jgi:hypothetical protein